MKTNYDFKNKFSKPEPITDISKIEGKRLVDWLVHTYDLEINNKPLTPVGFSYDQIYNELKLRLKSR